MTTLRVNGTTHRVPAAPDTPLLLVLRNDLRLASPKYGCGMEQCGSCMVLIDGDPTPTCRLPVGAVKGREIVTVEGLAPGDALHPVQQAFIDANAVQCGYLRERRDDRRRGIAGAQPGADAAADPGRPRPQHLPLRGAQPHAGGGPARGGDAVTDRPAP